MMKKLIVLGIVATMLMGFGMVAQAAAPAWVVSVMASSDTAALDGQPYASLGLSTRTTDQMGNITTGSWDPTVSELDYLGATTTTGVGAGPYAGTTARENTAKLSTSDQGVPSATQSCTWYFEATNNNADTPMYVTAWNLSTAQYAIPASLGYSITMYELTGLNGTPIQSSAYVLTNGTAKAANGTIGVSGVGGTYNQWTVPAGVNNVQYFEIVAGVPEPGSLVALFSGLVGLVGFGIRRRK
jgi:hypothetical protein